MTHIEYPNPRVYTEDEIKSIREAIENEKQVKRMFDEHEERIKTMRNSYDRAVAAVKVISKYADELKARIEQDEKMEFDYSDEVTICAAESMLADMMAANERAKGEGKV